MLTAELGNSLLVTNIRGVTLWDVAVQGQELDSMVLGGPFQLSIFHNSVISKGRCFLSKGCFPCTAYRTWGNLIYTLGSLDKLICNQSTSLIVNILVSSSSVCPETYSYRNVGNSSLNCSWKKHLWHDKV